MPWAKVVDMIFLGIGAWVAWVVGTLAAASTIVALAALKGSRPDERADILMALAVFVAALSFKSRLPERPSTKSLRNRGNPPEPVSRSTPTGRSRDG
jgi:hypothetical protein